MIGYRIYCTALLLILCASTSSAQKEVPTFPIVSAPDTTGLTDYEIRRSRSDAASLAFAWLDATQHPALDSIEFPPGLITSLRNALLHLATRKDFPALDSARMLNVRPRDWDGTTGMLAVNKKRNPWIKALLKGKKKTGNRTIDRLIAEYGLHVASRFDEPKEVTVEFATDSLVNVRGLARTIYEMKGMLYVDAIGFADGGWRTVKVSVADGKWRFTYEFADELPRLGWHRFTWLFDVAPNGSVTHVSSEHHAPSE